MPRFIQTAHALCLAGFWLALPLASRCQPIELISLTNTLWRYQENLNLDETGWELPDYPDSGWPAGFGLLARENSELLVVPIRTSLISPQDPSHGLPPPRTYYFRTRFEWPSQLGSSAYLAFSNWVDDGCVVYLNGVRLYDIGIPQDPAYYTNLAVIGREAIDTVTRTFCSPITLQPGVNVLAVSVHQSSRSSGDIVWGCSLHGTALFPLTLLDPAQPADRTLLQGRSTALRVSAAGPAPLTYQWFRNGLPISNATHASYTIAFAEIGINDGSYFCRVSDECFAQGIDSRNATVTVVADTQGPTLVRGWIQLDGSLLLSFSETLSNAFEPFGVQIVPLEGGTMSVPESGSLLDKTNWWLVPYPALSTSTLHRIQIEGGFYDPFGNATVATDVLLDTELMIIPIDETPRWRYDTSATDRTGQFQTPDFNDTGWPLGAALLARSSSPLPEPIRTPLVPSAPPVPVTCYFRTLFSLPPAFAPSQFRGLRMRTVLDDSAVFYINGQEVLRIGGLPDPIQFSSRGRTIGVAAYEGPFDLDLTGVVWSKTNTLAVEVHQDSFGSSDIAFGLELTRLGLPPVRFTDVRRTADGFIVLHHNGPILNTPVFIQAAPTVTGPFTNLPAGPHPAVLNVGPAIGQRFFRIQDPE